MQQRVSKAQEDEEARRVMEKLEQDERRRSGGGQASNPDDSVSAQLGRNAAASHPSARYGPSSGQRGGAYMEQVPQSQPQFRSTGSQRGAEVMARVQGY
jgi:hypothetical protein